MYLAHYGLKRKPFEISPDPDFLWLGEKHREGLARIKHGILENKGLLLITGDVGTGKTTLVRAIERAIGDLSVVVTIPDPGVSLMDFYNFMAAELKMDRSFRSKGEFLIQFKRFLLENFPDRKRILLIIDEAQRVKHDLLEEIGRLSDIDPSGKVLINIFLVGQGELATLLTHDRNSSLRQRIGARYHLSALTAEETRAYLEHRLRVAGATAGIFPPEASRAVFRHTRGYPGLINILCDYALMSGYSTGAPTLNPQIIAECAQELRIVIGPDPGSAAAPAAAETLPPAAATPPPPEANPPPRLPRSALVLAGCMVIVVAGWYVWGDAISGKPAGPDHGREQRAARDTNVVPDRAQSGRAAPGSPQNGTPAEKAENAAPNLEFTLTFAPDSVQLSSDARNVLALVVDLLRDFPLAVAVIEGHTDPGADPASNRAIAESRAAAAIRHLVRNGVAPARLSSVAMGSETPVESSGAFPEGGQNHRVVIRVAAAKPG